MKREGALFFNLIIIIFAEGNLLNSSFYRRKRNVEHGATNGVQFFFAPLVGALPSEASQTAFFSTKISSGTPRAVLGARHAKRWKAAEFAKNTHRKTRVTLRTSQII